MKLRFHARIASLFLGSLGAASLGAALPSCGAECAAACSSQLSLTVTNADATEHSFVITMTASSFGTLTETCGITGDAGTPTCTGPAFPVSLTGGQIQVEFRVDPAPFDVTVTQDGTQVASTHLTPTDGTNDVCGEVCSTGEATLALP
jgi:hypothetical protein